MGKAAPLSTPSVRPKALSPKAFSSNPIAPIRLGPPRPRLARMFLTFPAHIISLVRFAQSMAERLAVGLAVRLGIGRFGYTVFLPREEHERLDAEISYIEHIMRRALFLIAAGRGTLPPLARGAGTPPGQVKSDTPACLPGARHAPRFRLTEPQPVRARKTKTARFPASHPALHPAEAELIQVAREAPDALVPAGHLVRRYRALMDAVENPEPYIMRMRRLIGEKPRAVLSSGPASDAPSAHINMINRRILRMLQAKAQDSARLLDPG